jgi:SSS family solute:Na+ symporter
VEPLTIKALVIAAYMVIVLVIGAYAFRRTLQTAEDYFLGGRAAKTVVLFMALFGTNVTPFVLMGIPGLAYHAGIGVFGQNAAIVALGIPITFYLIGYPAWLAAKRVGAVTPAELYAKRFASPRLGLLMFVVFFVYTLPYMVTAVTGVGLAVDILSQGTVSFEVAAAGILAITIIYTSLGGMRATMWTNVFQGSVFLGFTIVAFFLIADDLGGVTSLYDRLREHAPALLVKGDKPPFQPGAWGSWALAISLTVIAFPHMLVRIFAAKDVNALKNACRYYPLALIILWLPTVMFGVWGAVEMPGLVGKASDEVFPRLVLEHLGPGLQGLALAGILAAVMSTLDAQMLTLSSMLSRDVLRRFWTGMTDRAEVAIGRTFLVVLTVVTYVIAVQKPASIFDIAKLSFSGYVTLVPTLYLSLRWRRFTAAGAIASICVGNLVLLLTYREVLPGLGLLPVAWGLGAAIVSGIAVSLVTKPADPELTDRVLGPIERAWASE